MQAIVASLLLLLLPLAALADGRLFPPAALPANVTIPDQRALIHFANGTERLVIETRFTGSGTNFAWVVPLPSQPVVEPASTGLFPTLQHLFQPRITYVPSYYLGILGLMLIIFIIVIAKRRLFVICCLLVLAVFAAMLLPALSTAGSKSVSSGAAGQGVSVLDRQLVGVFETTTIASGDPEALLNWLRVNGFAASTNLGPVITSYVKEGWVFVVAKVRRDGALLATSTPHPLSFSFMTAKPVYPLRLTGADNGPLQIELYVFGPARAEAPGFKVARCTQPAYPETPPNDWRAWRYSSPETPNIVHPLLRKWVDGSPVATKLTATLSPADMRQDVRLDWAPFREQRHRLFSRAGALTCALNWGCGTFATGLLISVVVVVGDSARWRRLPRFSGAALLLGLLLSVVVYLALPKTAVRLVRDWGSATRNNLYFPYFFLSDGTNLTPDLARAMLANASNIVGAASWERDWQGGRWDNGLLGGRIREEDSPGNYTFHDTGAGFEFITYDALGAPHVLGVLPWQPRP